MFNNFLFDKSFILFLSETLLFFLDDLKGFIEFDLIELVFEANDFFLLIFELYKLSLFSFIIFILKIFFFFLLTSFLI